MIFYFSKDNHAAYNRPQMGFGSVSKFCLSLIVLSNLSDITLFSFSGVKSF